MGCHGYHLFIRCTQLTSGRQWAQARTPTSKKGVHVQAEITRQWVTYRQAEEIAGLSRTTLRKLVDQGDIKITRVGRAVRINRESLDAYMNGDDLDAAR